ncbi:XisI protein-like protein [Tolypothrix sp. NIES-4075]|uniref:element excision factor XisI family protein n=1 Tax=Tolypothrix sp. NIES-4075 TaxID=2005459 RepID=UPI000B5C7310|nr:element excision factor XisI family protein [Tolypothrix sp. NIES-4075]GAX41381.1 XisI protein-like protein [Tolypothrix sp. NIES-4075]
MDKLTEYPKLIRRILSEYVELCNRRPNGDIETFLIVDESKKHYNYSSVVSRLVNEQYL